MFKSLIAGCSVTITCLIPLVASAQNAQTLPVRHIDNISELEMPTRLIPESWSDNNVATTTLASNSAETQSRDDVEVDSARQQIHTDPVSIIYDNQNVQETILLSKQPNVDEKVEQEIEAQTSEDNISSGQVAINQPTAVDNDAIISIENKNGKTYTATNLSYYAQRVNNSVWTPEMNKNSAMTVKLQTLLDWNHASPGPIDGGWGMNSIKALKNFQAMHGLTQTGRIDQATWDALNKNIDASVPVIVEYTLTDEDVSANFAITPSGAATKSKMSGLYYQNIKEMLAERFHMDIRYLDTLNKGKTFHAGETITVINVGNQLDQPIDRVVANKADETLYAYYGDQLVATYPTTVGSSSTPSPHGTYRIVNKVKMPWYRATVGEDEEKQVYMLPPGPNNPVGVVWMGLSKPSYGIHGSPIPEGISRQASHGCIRLTNWDVLEVYANIQDGATVVLE